MDLKELISTSHVMRAGVFLSQRLPERWADRLARWAAGLVSRFQPTVYHTVRANLKQVLGTNVADRVLHETTRQVFHSALRSAYDFYRVLDRPREELLARIRMPGTAQEVAQSLFGREGGSFLIFPHLSNFDLAGRVLAHFIPELQLITLPNPAPGFEFANVLREQRGITVTPLSPAALRQAIERLRSGGVVATAVDRPVSDLDRAFSFFGKPARVPSAPVRLALSTGAVIAVSYCVYHREDSVYMLHVDPPLQLIRTGDRQEEVRINMRLVLNDIEGVIRRWPGQWQMFVPVWPL